MQQRDTLAHFILISVVVLGLTLLVVVVEADAQIAFVSDRTGNLEIYVMDTDGGKQRRVTNNRYDDHSPSWSPDGKRIVFESERNGKGEIYVISANRGKPKNLTNNRHDDHSPSWSPDGKHIAFSSKRDGNGEIYVMDADGGNQRNLTR